MKVIHLCRTFSKLSETFIYDAITELDATEIENEVVTFKRIHATDRPFSKVHLLVPSPLMRAASALKKALSMIGLGNFDPAAELESQRQRLLHRFLKSHRPDLVHAHFGLQGWTLRPVATGLNIPFIVSFHGYDAFRLPESPIWRSRFRELFDAAEAITVVSKHMKAHLQALGCPEAKLQLIHVGKCISKYHYRTAIQRPLRNFISIGRLSEKKGFLDCIAAFKLLLKQYPDLSLKIIGTGEMEAQLQEALKDEALKNKIKLLGSLPHAKVKEALKQADAFILCSKTGSTGDKEGIPTVLMEAQAMGLPCISTLHSGIPEVIPAAAQNLLAREGDPAAIADKIALLINMPGDALEQIRQQGRQLIEAEFNLKKETYKLSRLMQSLVK